MRAGTQTLIQVLQALPWMNGDNEDDSTHEVDSDSDDDHTGSRSGKVFQIFRNTQSNTLQRNAFPLLSIPSTAHLPAHIESIYLVHLNFPVEKPFRRTTLQRTHHLRMKKLKTTSKKRLDQPMRYLGICNERMT